MANADLGILLQSLRGKVGNAVFNKGKGGSTTVRVRVRGTNPKTSAQVGVRTNLSRAAQTFRGFNIAQYNLWKAYAQTLTRVGKKSGKRYTPSAINAFTELTAKYLQINPTGSIPLGPPATPFTGDVITVTATAGTGKITFTASAANAANVRTELLVQPLKSRNRTPTAKGYRTRGFIAFAVGSLSADVTVNPGFYAVAYRFVNVNTGQEVALVPLPLLTVALAAEDGGEAAAPRRSRAA